MRSAGRSVAPFLKFPWDVLAALDFTTVEVWTKEGLVTFYLLFAREPKTRRVHFAGCAPNPEEPWVKEIARNLTDAFDVLSDCGSADSGLALDPLTPISWSEC